jgi:hypothetical protein
MKKSLVARGFTGIVASLLGVAAIGCGAATDEQGAEIDSTEQAIATNPTESGAYDAAFPAYIRLSATEALVVGGYNNSGNGITTIKKVTYDTTVNPATATWSSILDSNNAAIALSAARGEAQILEIPGHSGIYLVVGGRSAATGSTFLASAEMINLNAGSIAVNTVGTPLSSGRANFAFTKCGDKLLVAGGQTTGPAVSNKLEVFTFNATPANAGFDTMNSADDHTTDVAMTAGRMFLGGLKLPAIAAGSTDRIILFGGETTTTVLSSTETLDVDSNCEFVDNSGSKLTAPFAGPNLPGARTKFAAAARSVVVNVVGTGNVTHEAILAGGQTAASASPVTYVYDDNATASSAVWRSGPTLASAHVLPTFVEDPSSLDFALVGGYSGVVSGSADVTQPTTNILSTAEVDVFSDSGDSFSNPADLTESRAGAWSAYIGATPIFLAGQGLKRSLVMGSAVSTWLQTAE